jgi:hypothetical protein
MADEDDDCLFDSKRDYMEQVDHYRQHRQEGDPALVRGAPRIAPEDAAS